MWNSLSRRQRKRSPSYHYSHHENRLYSRQTLLGFSCSSLSELVTELHSSHGAPCNGSDEKNGPDSGDDSANGKDQDVGPGDDEGCIGCDDESLNRWVSSSFGDCGSLAREDPCHERGLVRG